MNKPAKLLREIQQTLKFIRKENKNKQTKTAKKQIDTAKNKVKRAKQKLKIAGPKYVGLENEAIEIRTELKETKKMHPHYGLTKKQTSGQFKKYRDIETPGTQRAAEVNIKKTTSMMVNAQERC